MQLNIELLSDTAPGSGEGAGSNIDRDIMFDSFGLPYIPARRLKGCLREAALEVSEALSMSHKDLEVFFESGRKDDKDSIINKLFGVPGAAVSGWLELDDAQLENASILKSWLEWAKDPSRLDTQKFFRQEAILDCFTGTRAQTAISRTQGSAKDNSLRVSRVIKRKERFVAKVIINCPVEKQNETRRALALACTALHHIGLSRNRGLGEVSVILSDETNQNWNAAAVRELADSINGLQGA